MAEPSVKRGDRRARVRSPAPVGAVGRCIAALERDARLRGSDIADFAEVSTATVSRWRSGRAKPRPRRELRLSNLHHVVGRLEEYYAPEEIRAWLYAPHPQLGGERALDLINRDRAIEVLETLDRLAAEAYL